MTSKTIRLNNRETSIIYSALSSELHLYEGWLDRMINIDPSNLSADKRADRDMLITSYQSRIETIKKLMEKV